MFNVISRAMAVLALFALAACGNSGVDLDADTEAMVSQVETEVSQVADQVEAAAADTAVVDAWDALEAELSSMVDSVRSGTDIDTEAIEAEMDQFAREVENSDVADELQEAWTELRSRFDALVAALS